MILAQSTFTIRRLAKDELSLVFSSDTVTIPVNNGVADLSIAEFGVKVLKGGRELFPVFDEEIGGRNLLPAFTSDKWEKSISVEPYRFTPRINSNDAITIDLELTRGYEYTLVVNTDHMRVYVISYDEFGELTRFVTGQGDGAYTFTVPNDSEYVTIYLDTLSRNRGLERSIWNLKLEKGDKATDWTSSPEEILSNAIITPHNCTAVIEDDKIKITSITPDKKVGYVDVAISYGEDNTALRRFTWATADSGISITKVDVEFAVNTNKTTPPTSGWDTLAPNSLTATQQLWTRTVTYFSKGDPNYSLPANITPQIGQGIESIVEEFAISTSKTVQPTTDWDTTPPTWSSGNYIWSRVKVTYKNPTEIKYTGYAVSAEWEAVNELETKVDTAFDVANDNITAVANRTTTLEDTTGSLTIRMSSAEQKITPESIVSTVTSSTKYTSNLGSKTYFSKPAEYKRGDRWVLTENTQLLDNLYLKGQMLEAVYDSGKDGDWRLMLIEGDEEATEGINLIRNYDFREGSVHWGAIEDSIVELDDELPTEFYTPSVNVIGDEYGYEYAITSENDELIIFDE